MSEGEKFINEAIPWDQIPSGCHFETGKLLTFLIRFDIKKSRDVFPDRRTALQEGKGDC